MDGGPCFSWPHLQLKKSFPSVYPINLLHWKYLPLAPALLPSIISSNHEALKCYKDCQHPRLTPTISLRLGWTRARNRRFHRICFRETRDTGLLPEHTQRYVTAVSGQCSHLGRFIPLHKGWPVFRTFPFYRFEGQPSAKLWRVVL